MTGIPHTPEFFPTCNESTWRQAIANESWLRQEAFDRYQARKLRGAKLGACLIVASVAIAAVLMVMP